MQSPVSNIPISLVELVEYWDSFQGGIGSPGDMKKAVRRNTAYFGELASSWPVGKMTEV